MSIEKYQICSNCVMDTSDPKITFNDKGVCDHCNGFYTNILPNWHTDEKGWLTRWWIRRRRNWRRYVGHIIIRTKGQRMVRLLSCEKCRERIMKLLGVLLNKGAVINR